jgi:hypothetical protein
MNSSIPNPSTRRWAGAFSLVSLRLIPLLLYLLPLFCACSLCSPHLPLTVHLPASPQHWQTTFPEVDFHILYPTSESGTFEVRRIDSRDRVILLLPKILYLPVLAYPSLPDQVIELPPAGGIYPLDCDILTESISLSWQQGAIAEVLYRLWSQGVDCSAINVPRLREEISVRCQGDPWRLDLDRICARLSTQTFNLTDIRLAPSRDLLLRPGVGSWFSESPFHSPISTQADGSLFLQDVVLGGHFLFETPPGACFFLYVDEGAILMVRR